MNEKVYLPHQSIPTSVKKHTHDHENQNNFTIYINFKTITNIDL